VVTSFAETRQPVPSDGGQLAESCDVLVIGGGPAGSTISSLLAEKGWKIILLEKDHHPRFHIGESLLPMNLPILERLGVLEQVRDIGILKPGVEMCSDHHPAASQTYYFEKALDLDFSYAFEVRRSEFDHLLLRNSAAKGVAVHEGIRVTTVQRLGDATSLVEAKDDTGRATSWQARYVVDASGRNAFLATRLGHKEKNPKHNSVAVFGHFEHVLRRPGRDEGNIGLYWFEHGWFWMIPLRDGIMSVGAVCWPDYLKTRNTTLEDFLMDSIRLCPGVAARMKEARLKGPAQATGNFSYRSKRMSGDGYLLIGDAYAFIDPVFSSGVYLAMNSAVMAADAVDAWLHDEKEGARQLATFEKRVERGLGALSWFIYRFTTPGIHALFMAPRNILRMEQAVLAVLAGDVFRRNRAALPVILFKGLYYLVTSFSWARSWAAFQRRKRNRNLDVADQTLP
jgi:flavin-dependent dehydrogenase